MGKVLYRKYRSKTLGEVIGQDHITVPLARALESGRLAHAYLFTGPRGVGKTSIARILAHEINGFEYGDEQSFVDIIEIDAASNTGVDDIRALRENINLLPMTGKKKIFIIDEVHMLSKNAFNALLKTLEEPPEHIVFILATTDTHKIPKTILSRVQVMNFRLISADAVAKHLRFIADKENIKITDEALRIIAEQGGGSFRDSISLLDQIANIDDEITAETLQLRLGLSDKILVGQLLQACKARDLDFVIKVTNRALDGGAEPTVLATQIIDTILESSEYLSDRNLVGLVDNLTGVAVSAAPKAKLFVALCSDLSMVVEKLASSGGKVGDFGGKLVENSARPVDNYVKSVQNYENIVEKPVQKLPHPTGASAKLAALTEKYARPAEKAGNDGDFEDILGALGGGEVTDRL
ncbi:MAG: DNA polymerase III subunit gamma/tau [Candidatus Nomurabacteria bacterium]|jgi:DNA polymerase-3 subunit gamma/tau|nr:DNA polymerase III subunit gamma/tau [Candidatus Nomurabacteria bacterium]